MFTRFSYLLLQLFVLLDMLIISLLKSIQCLLEHLHNNQSSLTLIHCNTYLLLLKMFASFLCQLSVQFLLLNTIIRTHSQVMINRYTHILRGTL
jgi:hypothetical protein